MTNNFVELSLTNKLQINELKKIASLQNQCESRIFSNTKSRNLSSTRQLAKVPATGTLRRQSSIVDLRRNFFHVGASVYIAYLRFN